MAEIKGWFYLHTNGQLIWKNNPDAIEDIRESDLCTSAWAFTGGDRKEAWNILVEALSIGAEKTRIEKLAKDWGIDDSDAPNYAEAIGIKLGVDGNQVYATKQDFIDLQTSPAGFGNNYLEAISELCKELGYTGGKMWNTTFEKLLTL